jgi:photosystem II stability/assembly factor-like uncharacterized protein
MKRLALLFLPLVVLGLGCNQRTDGGVYRSLDSGETWEQATFISSDGKRVQTISEVDVISMVFHPNDTNIIYLGTKENGLYITLTGGETWIQSKVDSGYIGAIAVDTVDPNNVYLAQGSSILKSTDQGATWETVYTDVKGATVTTLAVDSFEHSRVYAGTSAGNIYKSTDYGVNWDIRLQKGVGIKRLLIASHNTQIIYVLTNDQNLFQTVVGGEPIPGETADTINSGWDRLLEGDEGVQDITMDPNNSSTLFIATHRGLRKSVDDGKTWNDIVTLLGSNNSQNDSMRNMWVAPGKPNELYFTIDNKIHKSVDGGVTWKVIENFPSTRKIYRLLIDPETPNVMYVGMYKVEEKGGLIKQPK